MAYENLDYDQTVAALKERFGFDFVAIGLAPEPGAPLRWLHSSGATGERYKRIVLSPGHGIGGIVLKAGKPMMFTDIDNQLDPREYSSYPIVFAEDLRSFCALPLLQEGRVVGALLCAFRTADAAHELIFNQLTDAIMDGLCDFQVNEDDFLRFNEIPSPPESDLIASGDARMSTTILIGSAQENERKRISRELHDGVAQELLSVSMILKQIDLSSPDPTTSKLIHEANTNLDRIFDDIHNLSVELRPLALDDLGLVAALRTQADLYRRTFGASITVDDTTEGERYDRQFETQVYRIAQEAMLNACKYSDSDTVGIALSSEDEILTVVVYDQGKGFDESHPTIRGGGCGLAGMRERARAIKGNLDIHSGAGGTTVTLSAPVHVASDAEGSRP